MSKTVQSIPEGTIYDDGLKRALEIALGTAAQTQHGILNVTSDQVSGEIGIFCGQYITGAKTNSGETGKEALLKLLSLKSGNFAIVAASESRFSELKQSLSLDIHGLLENLPRFLENPNNPTFDESLTCNPQKDTVIFVNDPPHDSHSSMQNNINNPDDSSYKPGGEPLERDYITVLDRKAAFSRLKNWETKSAGYLGAASWALFFIVCAIIVVFFQKEIYGFISTSLPRF